MPTAALIVAAGRGTRLAGGSTPKQYLEIAGETVLSRTVRIFTGHAAIQRVLVVIHRDDDDLYRRSLGALGDDLAPAAYGGASRQESVRLGLAALSADAPQTVLIHDAARPFTSPAAIDGVVRALQQHDGAIAAQPVTDTLKRSDGESILGTVPREDLWRAQTPQGFRFAPILAAHRQAVRQGRHDFTDDAALAEWAGMRVAIVLVADLNMKITTAEDLTVAEAILAGDARKMETRTGQGFDVHRFAAGDHVWLCGLRIPHDHRLEGHSDADVGLHALTDALLGAIGDGDIGQHFPPSDAKWKGAASHLFLADAVRRVRGRGGRIVNADVTLLCEAPRISPHRDAMRARLADILGITIDRVGVKATTTEGLGFTGRREGIAAMAVASVMLPA